jgi:hypothetical protein
MNQYDNSNSGVLFRNDKKETENQPDYTGSWEDENGREMWLSAWLRESKNGTKFFSIKGTYKDKVQKKGIQQARQAVNNDFDDLPF